VSAAEIQCELPQTSFASPVSARGWDYLLLIATAVLCCLLMLQGVSASIGAPIVYGMAALCFLSPYSGLCLLAASQIVPDPPGAQLTVARLAFLGFVPSLLYHRYRFQYVRQYAVYVVPLTIWTVLVDLMMRGDVYVPPILAYIIGAAACLLISHRHVRTDLALLAICLGSLCGCLSWWAPKFGLEITRTELARAGLERLVAGRLAGVAGFPSALASVGLFALSLWPGSVCSRGLTRWVLIAASFAAAVSVPGTLGRGAIASLALGFLVLFYFQRGARLSPRDGVVLHRYRTATVLLFVVGLVGFLFNDTTSKSYLQAATEFTNEQMDSSGGVLGYERVDRMQRMVRLIAYYPVMGVPENQLLITPIGEGTKWALLGYTVPHNVFLGIGLSYGIPGMVMFGLLFFYPPMKILRHGNGVEKAALLACHAVFFTMFMLFPFGNFKTFYLLLAIEFCWLQQTQSDRFAPSAMPRPATA